MLPQMHALRWRDAPAGRAARAASVRAPRRARSARDAPAGRAGAHIPSDDGRARGGERARSARSARSSRRKPRARSSLTEARGSRTRSASFAQDRMHHSEGVVDAADQVFNFVRGHNLSATSPASASLPTPMDRCARRPRSPGRGSKRAVLTVWDPRVRQGVVRGPRARGERGPVEGYMLGRTWAARRSRFRASSTRATERPLQRVCRGGRVRAPRQTRPPHVAMRRWGACRRRGAHRPERAA